MIEKNSLEDIVKRLGALEKRLADDTKRNKPQVTNKFPNHGKLWESFNRKNTLADITAKINKQKLTSIPKVVTNLAVDVQAISVNGRTMNRLTVRWVNQSDPNYDGARIWMKGYQTDNEMVVSNNQHSVPFVCLAEIQDSPFTCNLEATGEEIQIAVQPINKDRRGADLTTLPYKNVLLTTGGGKNSPQPSDESGNTLF